LVLVLKVLSQSGSLGVGLEGAVSVWVLRPIGSFKTMSSVGH